MNKLRPKDTNGGMIGGETRWISLSLILRGNAEGFIESVEQLNLWNDNLRGEAFAENMTEIT